MICNLAQFQRFLLVFYLFQTPFDGGGYEPYQQAISTIIILLFWALEFFNSEVKDQGLLIGIPFTFKFFVIFVISYRIPVVWRIDKGVSTWGVTHWEDHVFVPMGGKEHVVSLKVLIMVL